MDPTKERARTAAVRSSAVKYGRHFYPDDRNPATRVSPLGTQGLCWCESSELDAGE